MLFRSVFFTTPPALLLTISLTVSVTCRQAFWPNINFTGTSLYWLHHLIVKQRDKIGAGGGTRTRTTFYGPRILSPVRLPFRHTGNIATTIACNYSFAPCLKLLRYLPRFTVMNGLATSRTLPASIYQKVFDSRKRRVRGWWQRKWPDFGGGWT